MTISQFLQKMEQNKKSNYTPYIWTTLCILAFISSVLIAGYMLRYFINYSDEPYQILNSMDYKNSPLAPLTAIMDNITNRLFDYQILKLRYVAFCYTMLSIMLSGWYFAKKTGKTNIALILCSVLTLLTIRNLNITLIGWDRQTMLFVTILVISTLEFFETGKRKFLIICAVASAVASLCRIPSAASLVFIPVLILWKSGDTFKQKAKDIVLFLAISIAIIIGALLLMYGSLSEYFNCIKANLISAHNNTIIVYFYILYFYNCLKLCFFYSLFYFATKKIKNKWIYFCSCIIFTGLLILHINSKMIEFQYFNGMAWISVIIFIELSMLIKFRNNLRSGKGLATIALIVLSTLPMLASNVGMSKYLSYTAIPIALSIFYPYINRRIFWFGTCISIIFFACTTLYMCKNYYFGSLTEQTSVISQGKLKGIHCTPIDCKMIDEIFINFTPRMSEHNIVVCQNEGIFYFELEFDTVDKVRQHSWTTESFDDDEYAARIRNQIRDNKFATSVLVIYKFYGINSSTDSKMTKMLNEELELAVSDECYAIYVPKKHNDASQNALITDKDD